MSSNTRGMRIPKRAMRLSDEQREALIQMIAAGYNWPRIREAFEQNEWRVPTPYVATYYRQRYVQDIDAVRKLRYLDALSTGLAVKAERVQRLKDHADDLEKVRLVPDEDGKLQNEKAWRETLHQIAEEMGQLRQIPEAVTPREMLLQRMNDLGLTLDDIQQDPIASELFRNAGILPVSQLPDETDRRA